MLHRRDTLRGLALTIGLGATGWAERALAAAPPTSALTWTPVSLTPDQARLVDVVAELIIPKTDTPGAREAGVPEFIDRALANYCDKDQAERLRAGLARMEADAQAAHGVPFIALTPEQQVALFIGYERESLAAKAQTPSQSHFFPDLEDLVTVGYFTSEPGATVALQYDPVPGAYRGCVPLSEIGRAWATR